MKELIVIVLLLSVSQIKDNTFQTSSEDLHHKSELSSLALNNMRHNYFHRWPPVKGENKITNDQFLANTLLFKDFLTNHQYYNDLLVQFNSKETTDKFKAKTVDIYGLAYDFQCNGGEPNKTNCIYGGLTTHEDNKLDKPKNVPINLWIDGAQKRVSLDKVKTDKKTVTIQELDAQARYFLQGEYLLYHNDSFGGKIQKGFIEFHDANGFEVSYDLFDVKGDYPDTQLRIYNDNKTISSKNLHIDIYLFTK